jgi:DNA-directed RNA polymerase subunit M/transcription elongation factor TFIIS
MTTPVDLRLLNRTATALDIQYYTNPKFNASRRIRLMLIDASTSYIDNLESDKPIYNSKIANLIHNLEVGAINYAYDMCIRHGHMPNWNDYRFCRIYDHGAYKIQSLLQKRPDVVKRMLSGDINPSRILYLPTHELIPEKKCVWDTENIRKTQTVVVKVTTDYPCPRCDVRSALQYEVQTRGADEESTSKFQCQSCHKVWSEND